MSNTKHTNDDPSTAIRSVEIREPKTTDEFAAYFELRWHVLRAPWNQLLGSEKDEFEDLATHIVAITAAGELIGIGRIHKIDGHESQIRYMATKPDYRGQGVGTRVVGRLERIAVASGTRQITLNAREPVVSFYEGLGYRVIGEGPTLFGEIRHKKMIKRLDSSTAMR